MMVVFSSFSEPTARVHHEQPNTTVYVNDNNIGKGTLYVAESYLSWRGDSGNGFTLEYPHISLHAISRDLTAFANECIFMMLDTDFSGEAESNSLENGDSEDQVTTELRLVPDDRGMLDAIFNALNVCQTLHPDPEDSFSDEDFFEDADEDANEDIYMEETDFQMANMRIRNTDVSSHMNFVGGFGSDPYSVLDRVDSFGTMNMKNKNLLNIDLKDKVVDREKYFGPNMEKNFAADTKKDFVADIEKDSAEDIFEDMEEDIEEGKEEDAEEGKAEGKEEGTEGIEFQDIAVARQGIAVARQNIAVARQGIAVEQRDTVEGENIAENHCIVENHYIVENHCIPEGQDVVESRLDISGNILDGTAQGGKSSSEGNM